MASPGNSRSSKSNDPVLDPVEEYLDQINRRVYGDETTKATLHGLLSLFRQPDTQHLTKRELADESGITVQQMYNHSIPEVLQDFGIVELVTKVNREGEAYLIPNGELCRVLDQASKHGPSIDDLPSKEERPCLRKEIERYGERLSKIDTLPSQPDDDVPSPRETRFEIISREVGIQGPIEVSMSVSSEPDNSSASSGTWRFRIEGCVIGELQEIDFDAVEDRLKQEMVAITIAALKNHRVKCPCKDIRQHLIKVASGEADFVSGNIHEVKKIKPDKIRFETVVTKIKSDPS